MLISDYQYCTSKIKELPILVISCVFIIVFIGFLFQVSNMKHRCVQSFSRQKPTEQMSADNYRDARQKYNAYIMKNSTINVFPYINGFIDKVLVKNGQSVAAGEPLFVIQQRQYLIQKEIAQSNFTAAQKALNQAQNRLNKLEQTALHNKLQNELNEANQAFLSAQKRINNAELQLKTAQTNYDYTLVQSPIDGIIDGIFVAKGNYVSPAGKPLVRILSTKYVRVVFEIDMAEYNQIKERVYDAPDTWIFKLQLLNGEIYPYKGSFFKLINRNGDNCNDMFLCVDFPNPQGVLSVNSPVRVIWEKKIKSEKVIREKTISPDRLSFYVYSKSSC